MRKSLLVLVSAAFAFTAGAQVTLTSAVHGWNPGDVENFNSADTVGVNPGPSGTGQTWNFSTLNIGASGSTPILAPSATPYGSSFPTATCAIGSGGSYYYYKSNASGISIVGLGTSSYIMTYSNIDEISVFPFSYGSSNSETHTASYTVSSYTGTRGGYTVITADGSGTLILPSGSYNVLRLKTEQQDRDSLMTTGYISTSTTYTYYSATQKFPLLQIESLTVDNGFSTQTTKAVFVNTAVVGMEEPNQLTAFSCFPNPATDELNVRAELQQGGDVSIELSDISGRIVFSQQYGDQPEGTFNQVLNVAELPAGLYTMRVQSGNSVSQRKISVQ